MDNRHNVGSPRLEEELGRVGIHQRVSGTGLTTTAYASVLAGCSLKTGCLTFIEPFLIVTQDVAARHEILLSLEQVCHVAMKPPP